MAVYVLVAIIRKKLDLKISLYTMLQVLSVSVFEKVSLLQLFAKSDYRNDSSEASNQLNLFS